MKTTVLNSEFKKRLSLYTIGSLGSKAILLFLYPIATFYLSPEELGSFDYIFAIALIIFPLISLNLTSGMYRYASHNRSESQKLIGTLLAVFIPAAGVLLLLVPFMALWLPDWSFNPLLYGGFIWIFSFYEVYIQYVRGTGRTKLFVLSNLTVAALTLSLSVVFLLYTSWKASSLLIAYAIARIVAIIGIEARYRLLKWHVSSWREVCDTRIIRYSLLLLPGLFALGVIDSWSRLFITQMVGTEANGLFAISLKIASIFFFLTSIYQLAWHETVLRTEKERLSTLFSSHFNNYLIMLAIGGLLFYLVSFIAYPYMVDIRFLEGRVYLFPIIVGYILLSLAHFLGIGYDYYYKTTWMTISSVVAMGLSLVLNLLFIPWWGVTGCLYATILAYLVLFLFRLVYLNEYIRIYLTRKGSFAILLILFSVVIYLLRTTYV